MRSSKIAVFIACALLPAVAQAQNHFPLEVTQPPPDNGPNHRAKWAAPGLPYNVPVGVIGGNWPYTFTLSNAPAGMTIRNAGPAETCGIAEQGRAHVPCGVIDWPNPQGPGSVTPTVTVRDASGATATRTYTIQVSMAPFRFVDAVNGRNAAGNGCTTGCGDGTLGNPWRTLKDVNVASASAQITYFKTGQYTATDLARFSMGGEGEGVEFTSSRSTTWLAYPGSEPVIDHGAATGARLQMWMWGPMVYVDGITHQNGGSKYYHVLGDAASAGVFRRNTFTGLIGDVSNASFIMTPHNPVTSGMLIQENAFLSATGQLATRLYDTTKVLIEGNLMTGISNGLDPKDNASRVTFRGNRLLNFPASRWGSFGMSGSFNNGSSVEMYRNLFMNFADAALDIGASWTQPCNTPTSYYYDNTFVGRIFVSRLCAPTLQVFARNVIVNGDGATTPLPYFAVPPGFGAPDWSRVQASANLTAAPSAGIVDGNGQLAGTARTQWLGQRGYELGGGSGPVLAACGDGIDNDGDTLIDLADPGCADANDTDETNIVVPPQCTYGLAPTSANVPASSSTGTVTVTASPSTCTWTAASNVAWVTLTTSGSTVTYAVATNTGSARTGTATIAGQIFTINQAVAPPQPTGCLNGTTSVPTGDVIVEQMSDGNATQRQAIAARVAALQRAGFAVELTAKSTYTTLYATCGR